MPNKSSKNDDGLADEIFARGEQGLRPSPPEEFFEYMHSFSGRSTRERTDYFAALGSLFAIVGGLVLLAVALNVDSLWPLLVLVLVFFTLSVLCWLVYSKHLVEDRVNHLHQKLAHVEQMRLRFPEVLETHPELFSESHL